MCDVIETLVLLCHCGRINNTGNELTSAVPLLSCVCAYLKLTVATAGCLNCLCWLDLLFHFYPCMWGVNWWTGHPELDVLNPCRANCKTPGTAEQQQGGSCALRLPGNGAARGSWASQEARGQILDDLEIYGRISLSHGDPVWKHDCDVGLG